MHAGELFRLTAKQQIGISWRVHRGVFWPWCAKGAVTERRRAMGVQKRIPWLFSLGVVLAAMALWGTRAGADVVSDRPGSVVIWPKVIADGTRDTIIKLTNTSNLQVYAHCEYVVGTGLAASRRNTARASRLSRRRLARLHADSRSPAEPVRRQLADERLRRHPDPPAADLLARLHRSRREPLPAGQRPVHDLHGRPRCAQSCPGLFPVGMVPPRVCRRLDRHRRE